MANDLGNAVDTDVISQTFLDAFYKSMAPINAFTTDFSSDVSVQGAGVVTRIPALMSAQTKACSADYSASDVSVTDVTVSLDQHKYVDFELCEVDLAKSMVDIERTFINPAADALAKSVHDYVQGLILNASFSNSITKAASAFDYDELVDLEAACDTLGWDENKSLVLPSTYVATLRKDTAVTDGFKNQVKDDSLVDGSIGRLGGFNIFKDNRVPANGENLAGFAADKRGLAVALRPLPALTNGYGEQRVVTIGEGLSVRFTHYADMNKGALRYRWDILFGATAANGDGIYRIASA